jgi:predicted DNA-binding transcriptional regulator AlpA
MVPVTTEPPRIVGTHQIAKMLGVTRSRCAQIVNTKGFPDPFTKLGAAHIWLADDVETWAASVGREVHPWE